MASHTGVYDVFPHIRNLPSDVLKGIAELGGVVGIYTLTFGLSVRNPTPSFAPHYEFGPFLEHLTAAVQCCGINAVGIGSDGTYRDIDAAVGEVHFQQLKQQLDPDGLFQARFPDHPLDLYSHQKLKKLVRAVSDIVWPWEANAGEKIMGNNFARFLREALPKE
jgi:microsomal dipeptidase-like Zn-dependent dipeptidase